MGHFLGKRAVVVGAGIGGLSAAGVLARYFSQVDVLERDQLPTAVGSRAGTPQDRHSHGLLAGGLQALGEIYPSFEQDLAGAGAVRVQVSQDIRWERADVGALPQRDLGLSLLCASRPLIEHVLRRRAEALANVTLRPGCRVTQIRLPTRDAGGAAVHFEFGHEQAGRIDAELVLDASGRGAPTLALLDALGWGRPAVTEVGVDISYATAVVQIPSDAPGDWKLAATFPDPPAWTRHAVLLPIEGNRWTVTLAEHGGPRVENWETFLDGLRGLVTPTLHDALCRAEPPDAIQHYGFRASQWRHFERLPRLPRAVLPIADAFCRFNPIYGQGMSSAAKQVRLLLDVLERAATEADPIAVVQAGFMSAVASVLQTPWSLSTTADFTFPGTRGEKPENFDEGRQFEAALIRAVVADPVVHQAFMNVMLLLEPDTRLQDPDILRRIEAASVEMAAA